MANIDSKSDSFIYFTIKLNSKDYLISIFSGILNLKKYSINFFPEMFNPKFEFGFIQFIKTSFKSSEYAPLMGKIRRAVNKQMRNRDKLQDHVLLRIPTCS